MIAALQHWFGALSLREKVMVSVAAALLGIIIAVFLIALPLLTAIEKRQSDYVDALDRRATVEARIAQVADAKAPAAGSLGAGSLQQVISQSAAEAGFALDRADAPAPDTTDIAMAKARAPALMVWLNDWESRGVIIRRIDMKAGNDGTISMTASLQRPSTQAKQAAQQAKP